jgi:hypothetical protein
MSFIKECSDPHLGSYDMRLDTTDMPKSLATKLNSHICNKGGGGSPSTTTTVSGIDPEFKPYLEKVIDIATTRVEGQFDEEGNLIDPSAAGIVAGLQGGQTEGLSAQEALARQALSGSGIYDDTASVNRMLSNVAGNQTSQMLGSLGSARGDRARQSALADMAYDIQQGRQQKAEGGAQSLQDVGSVYQEQEQKVLDAPYTELQRYANVVLGNAPTQSTSTSSGGGGGK